MNSQHSMDGNKSSHDIQVTQVGSVKFAQIDQFLSEDDRNRLFNDVLSHQAAFRSPGIPGQQVENSTTIWLTREFGKAPSEPCLIDQVSAALSEQIMQRLPELFMVLGLEPLPVDKLSIEMMSGLNGHYGLPHIDDYGSDIKLTVLYYFHQSPKAYHGGDLQLFESNPATETGYNTLPLITIEHQDNLLLAFASDTFHGVTEVQGGAESFESSRFVTVSFIGS